jgi:serine/threonine protein kinase
METVHAPTSAFRRAVFEDALGLRHHADSPSGEPLEVFEVREQFDTESFERALRDRMASLSAFHSTWFSKLRTVQRVNQNNVSKLFVVYDRVPGARLADVIAAVQQPLEVNATLCLIRQLVAAVALLHEKLPTMAHGAIAAERVIITPKARLVVSDYVLGGALEHLRYSTDQYWNDLRVPLPNDLEPSFDQRADVMQIGILALELILGRHVSRDEYPVRIHELTEKAWAASAAAEGKSLPPELRMWLLRMLQLDTERAFASAVDAWEDLEHVLIGSDNRASFIALEAVVSKYTRATMTPTAPVAAAPVAAAPVAAQSPTTPKPTESTVVASQVQPSTPVPTPAATPSSSPAIVPAAASLAPPKSAETESAFTTPIEDVPLEQAPSKSGKWLAAAAALVVLVGGGAMFGRQYFMPAAAAEAPGTLVVSTNPAGVQVIIDGQPRGVTPLTVELAPGSHELRLEAEGGPRIIPFTVKSGNTVSQTLELPKVAPSTGQLSVRSEPAGARVTVDGAAGGTTPLTIEGLAPGVHTVTLQSDATTVTQEVTIEPGATASLVVPMTAPQGVPVSGWVTVQAPAEVQIFEEGRLVGTSASERVMVTTGRHAFDIVNNALGFHARQVVTVAPGKVATIKLQWPTGTLALNAQPWADVFIAGQRVGETPIGSVTLPIGTHEVTFRHPELGEQVVRATVTTAAPARVSVDMRKK